MVRFVRLASRSFRFMRSIGSMRYADLNLPTIMDHSQFISTFNALVANGEWLLDNQLAIAGRMTLRRDAGSKLSFLNVDRDLLSIQVMMNLSRWNDQDAFRQVYDSLNIGDILLVHGYPGRTKKGELTVQSTKIQILTPCIARLPKGFQKITDDNIRYRQRYLDMLVNKKPIETFKTRAKIIGRIRQFLDAKGFVEVETPILSSKAGGANAKPFKTHSDTLHLDLELRVAPEIFLKQLVIGGMEKVYEIGKQFRNEGIDNSHNPEFTSCELYQSFASLEDMMQLTQDILRDVVQTVNGSLVVDVSEDSDKKVLIDFSAPFPRINITQELERSLKCKLPDLNSKDSLPLLLDVCSKNDIKVEKPFTLPRIVDKMVSHLIEPNCIQPTFLYGHPICMSPLAKSINPGIAERFELFIAGKELINSYLELNDPQEQRERFEAQKLDKNMGDVDAQSMDEEFCTALEFGLPPTSGWGLGVDRLCMLLTRNRRIRDVITFSINKKEET